MIVFPQLGKLGRDGNQLFQVAAAISHAKKMNTRAQFPAWEFNKYLLHPVDDRLDLTYDEKFDGEDHEPHYGFSQFHYSPLPVKRNLYLVGFYQSEKYFDPALVAHHFMPKAELIQTARAAGRDYLHLSHITAVHVRRGDYLERPDHHPVLPLEYYAGAMARIRQQYSENANFVFFSDDIEWCKSNFTGPNLHFAEGNAGVVDLYTMAMCRHHIIANSSFSWWGSWLRRLFPNEQPQTIIAPPQNRWFGPAMAHYDVKDLYCDEWEVLSLEAKEIIR